MLRNARPDLKLAGYEVQTIRISAQPFPEYTHGMSKQAILAFFSRSRQSRQAGKLHRQHRPRADVRKGMTPRRRRSWLKFSAYEQPARQHRGAGDDGVHWKAVHRRRAS